MSGLPEDHARAAATPSEIARARWGLDRVRLVHDGGDDDGDLGRALQRHLRHLPVVMLQDRLLPGAMLAEFLAVGPGGVTVIVRAGGLSGPLRVERLRGVFGACAELLRDGAAADRTALLQPVSARVDAVRGLTGPEADVAGALCLGDDAGPDLLHPLHVGALLVGGPRPVARLCARQGRLTDVEVAVLVDLLHAACPAALL